MSRNVRVLHCTPEDVFEVLGDGWLYPVWVVGASRMREVDETWPMTGAELHHSFGVWPALINDKTVVEQFVPGKTMVMRARGWPIGEARVTIDVKPRGDECVVRIQEEAIAGPGRFVPAPLMDVALHWRNDETLHRLAYLSEGRAARRTATTAEQEMAASGEKKRVDVAPAADRPDSEQERSATNEREDGAMTRDDEGSEPVAPTAESEWVDAATSIDAVEAGPADEPGESESLPPKKTAPRAKRPSPRQDGAPQT
ncbi:SRPBCC family protein [Microbacterium sp. E-13]|uniref:SRPBCC family protein n=1 Tax=Microbacterium sp. E-13 TaxID=3404048 RepID=UPI003CF3338B